MKKSGFWMGLSREKTNLYVDAFHFSSSRAKLKWGNWHVKWTKTIGKCASATTFSKFEEFKWRPAPCHNQFEFLCETNSLKV